MNTTRAANYWCRTNGEEGRLLAMGSVGSDATGKMICAALEAEKHPYSIVEVKPAATGLCAVTVNNVDRTCIAILEACERYPLSHMKQVMTDDMMKNCICTYSTGFFIESNF